jgi:4-diphosphocytidyl-2-C-methyl-D-erythritol kinase
MPALMQEGRAKVNLTLRVVGRRVDGYHDLESVVAFADCADRLTLTPGSTFDLSTTGPLASACGDIADNLVFKATKLLGERVPDLRLGVFSLDKVLPVAAGIGGGSADAAAALRLLARLNDIPLDGPAVMEAARATGADVPVCVAGCARLMEGAGERLGPPLRLPPLFAVLVNPRVPLETADVFRTLGLRAGQRSGGEGHPAVEAGLGATDLLGRLARARNDLEPQARTLTPAIGEAVALLAHTAGCRLARMSGSGATVFGLFETCAGAAAAARLIRAARPGWWVKGTSLR